MSTFSNSAHSVSWASKLRAKLFVGYELHRLCMSVVALSSYDAVALPKDAYDLSSKSGKKFCRENLREYSIFRSQRA